MSYILFFNCNHKKYLPLFCLLFLAVFIYLNQSVKATSTEQELRDKFQEKLIEASDTTDMPDFKDPKNFLWRDTVQDMIDFSLGNNQRPDWNLPENFEKYKSRYPDKVSYSIGNPTPNCNWNGVAIPAEARAIINISGGEPVYAVGSCERGLSWDIPIASLAEDPVFTVTVYYRWWGVEKQLSFDSLEFVY